LVEILGPMVEKLKILGCFHMKCLNSEYEVHQVGSKDPGRQLHSFLMILVVTSKPHTWKENFRKPLAAIVLDVK
jgi:hypothetical protein